MKNILILISLTLFLFGCKKGPNDSEPNTDPNNIITCKVNGEKHIYSGVSSFFQDDGVTYIKYNKDANSYSVFISGDNTKYDDLVKFEIFTWDIELNKKYEISNEAREDHGEYVYGSSMYYKTQQKTGYVVFTQFSDASVAGNFSFTAYTEDSTQKIEITDGYFNIQHKK